MKCCIKKITINVALSSFLLMANSASADFGTLFTTSSERKIINDNRYVIKKAKTVTKSISITKIEKEEPKLTVYKTISKEYKISGISIANNGVDTAWINNKLHDNGDILDKKVTIKINSSKRKVRFIVRGGKTFKGQSGDVVTVSYRVPLFD